MSWVEEDPELLVQVPTSISEQVLSATILLGRGREALAAGDSEDALAWILSASDEIRAVTDEGVAHRLVGTGEALLDEADESILEVARARRMMNGARRALTEGEYRLAIQRAFYARQLLEGAEHSPMPVRR